VALEVPQKTSIFSFQQLSSTSACP